MGNRDMKPSCPQRLSFQHEGSDATNIIIHTAHLSTYDEIVHKISREGTHEQPTSCEIEFQNYTTRFLGMRMSELKPACLGCLGVGCICMLLFVVRKSRPSSFKIGT